MIIGWGALGTCWSLPMLTVYVRSHRYTKAQIDKTGEFTVSIPMGNTLPDIVKVCGLQSGRKINKADYLSLEEPEVNNTPGVKEYPLTLECKVLYSQRQDLFAIPEEIRQKVYPQDIDGLVPMANRDPHTAYIGQILAAYIIR